MKNSTVFQLVLLVLLVIILAAVSCKKQSISYSNLKHGKLFSNC